MLTRIILETGLISDNMFFPAALLVEKSTIWITSAVQAHLVRDKSAKRKKKKRCITHVLFMGALEMHLYLPITIIYANIAC